MWSERNKKITTAIMQLAPPFILKHNIYSSFCIFNTKKFFSSVAKRIVLISNSHDIYTNLAYEDWIYNSYDFQKEQVLYIWRNSPCVVIGKHQNPWTECNLENCLSQGIPVARRRSGGGAVYHDLGNANFTFFTSRKSHDRHYNLTMITEMLKRMYSMEVSATPRDDILLSNKYKISGSASKIGGKIAYHHCTLLLDVDTEQLNSLLVRNLHCIRKSSGTESVPASVINLQEVTSQISYDKVCEAMAKSYTDGRMENHHVVNPADMSKYPSVHSSRTELMSWNWIYGKTPKFIIDTAIPIEYKGSKFNLMVNMQIQKGHIESVTLGTHPLVLSLQYPLNRFCKDLSGCRFWTQDISSAARKYGLDKELWTTVLSHLLKIVK